ncbi:hypothetical protein V6N11_015614 [Hibiscus sabdariffa]|uniref:RNase H type-1 domain-containing protein n=1 Tax=Hibiscus sabdariffa TaxID=183260 RepID=A0ABR2TSM7_9ROSI
MGCFVGLSSAWKYELRNVVVESNSMDVIQLIQNLDDCQSVSSLFLHIHKLTSRDWTVVFQHVFREGNMVADRFSRAANLNDFVEFDDADRRDLLGYRLVVSFVTYSSEWKLSELELALPLHVLLRLAAIKCSLLWFGDARVGWSRIKDLKFTVKSVYSIRCSANSAVGHRVWSLINKYRGLQKIKIFM